MLVFAIEYKILCNGLCITVAKNLFFLNGRFAQVLLYSLTIWCK